MNHLMTITKSDGMKQLFEEKKLINSLERVGANHDVIDEVICEVEKETRDGMTTADIYHRAFALLHKHSRHIAVKYSIRRAMLELGPDGFPFEKFVARIFQIWGFETLTDQALMGKCVEHEIDVVAWKANQLIMIEAKYHNEFGMKSDIKVVLYVKARFDDLSLNTFQFGGKMRGLTDRYLITNTKFTDKAITYGKCSGLNLIGWNYPAGNSLHEIIGQNGLHPISCITSLSRDQKKNLIGNNVLVCVDIIGNPDCLDEIGVRGNEKEKVLSEVQMIIEEAK